MPNGDSLTIRHTPGTVPGGARPGWGLPHEQLPAATRRDLTPESFLDEQIQSGRQRIQDKYALQWKEVNRSKRFVGAGKTKRMLRDIDAKAKQEMLRFNQQAQAQMAQIQNVNRLAEQGMIYNPDEVKARMVFGADVARSMYPKPKSVEQQFGALEIHLRKLESRLAQFGREKKRIKKWYLGKEKEPMMPGELEILDESQIRTDKEGRVYRGIWRKATPGETAEHRMLVQERERIKSMQKKMLGRPDVRQRIVQPGTKGGTFGDKVTESIGRPTKRHDPLGLFD